LSDQSEAVWQPKNATPFSKIEIHLLAENLMVYFFIPGRKNKEY